MAVGDLVGEDGTRVGNTDGLDVGALQQYGKAVWLCIILQWTILQKYRRCGLKYI